MFHQNSQAELSGFVLQHADFWQSFRLFSAMHPCWFPKDHEIHLPRVCQHMQRTDTHELRDSDRSETVGPVASSLQEPGKSGVEQLCAVVMGSAATTQMIAKIDAEVEAGRAKTRRHRGIQGVCLVHLAQRPPPYRSTTARAALKAISTCLGPSWPQTLPEGPDGTDSPEEITIGMLIIVNSVIMAIEFEYQGLVESVVCCETLHVLEICLSARTSTCFAECQATWLATT